MRRKKQRKQRARSEVLPALDEREGADSPTEESGSHDRAGEAENVEKMADIRIERVLEIRQALRSGDYDVESRMGELLGAFEREVGQMCGPNR